MGADKNFSEELNSTMPNITSKGSHKNLPRSRSHNRPTNPRNKSQTNPKRKHNSRSKGLRLSAKPLANGPRGPGGRSDRLARTICIDGQNLE
jgi:hypothetical protein